MNRRAIVALLSALLVAGCTATSDGSQNVFTVQRGVTQGGPASTVDVVDIGLPSLHNLTARTVTLRWVRLVEHYKGMRILSVTAYKYSQVAEGIAAGLGDLRKHCRKEMIPYPVAGDATPPDKDSNWLIIIAMSFSKPGRYGIKRAKIGYRTNGQAKPGTKPVLTSC